MAGHMSRSPIPLKMQRFPRRPRGTMKTVPHFPGKGLMTVRRPNWLVLLGSTLVVSSLLAYLVHYALFRDSRHIFLYLIGDLAFLPVQVLFVILIVDRLLGKQIGRAHV